MKAVRQSTRQVKLSKDFKVVDEETRRAFREQRLVQLEQDNYNEQEIYGGGGDDEGYSDVSVHIVPNIVPYNIYRMIPQVQKEKNQKFQTKSLRIRRTNGKYIMFSTILLINFITICRLNRPPKSLERILLDNGISPENKDDVNYFTVVADPPSNRAKRPFCSVCGYYGVYTCTRCGSRFCSIRCNESHKETRCMKFSM